VSVRTGVGLRLLVLMGVLVTVIVGSAAPAQAATLVDSSPRTGDLLAGPVPMIWLQFDERIHTTRDTFEVVDHNGFEARFTTTTTATVVTLTFDEPLPGGRYRLEWAVGQGDTTRRGVLPFEVMVDGVSDGPGLTGRQSAPPLIDGPIAVGSLGDASSETPLGEFRTRVGDIVTWERAAETVRTTRDVAALLLVGSLLFLGWLHTGPADEIRWLVRWTRSAAIVAAVAGTAIAAIAVARTGSSPVGSVLTPTSWVDALTTSAWFELGAVLVAAGGAATLSGRRGLTPKVASVASTVEQPLLVEAGSSAPRGVAPCAPIGDPHPAMSWRYDLTTAPAAIGSGALAVLALAVSDTLARGEGLFLFPFALLHTAAAAIWLGTAGAAIAVLSRRFAARQPLDAPAMVVSAGRLVMVAAAVLGVSGLAGAVVAGRPSGEVLAGPKVALLTGALALVVVNRVLLAPRLRRGTRWGGLTRGLLTLEALLLGGAVLASSAAVVS